MIDETRIEYKIFSDTFMWLKISGFWMPTTLKHHWMKWLFGLYIIIAYTNMSLVVIEPISYIVTTEENLVDALAQNWYLSAIASQTLYMGINVTLNRKEILKIIRTKLLAERWTNLRDSVEEQIINASGQSEQNLIRYWMYMALLNGVVNVTHPITSNNPDKDLIFSTWKCCDTQIPSCFWFIWTSQFLCFITGSVIHVAAQCIALNMIERLCSHCRILQHRFSLMPDLVSKGMLDTAKKEKVYLVECIHDHQNIYSTAKDISNLFSKTITLYFVLNLSVLCTNIYLVSNSTLFSPKFMAAFLYLCSMLTQALILCWCGFKITQMNDEISYAIFSMNWLKLQKDTRKSLRFIMLSLSKSIPLFNNFLVELSPETFLRIVKVSYSAYNILESIK